MRPVLVHEHPVVGPVGCWSLLGVNEVEFYYEDARTPKGFAERGEALMRERGDDPSILEWFAQLTERSTYFESWSLVSAEDDEPLEAVLGKVQQSRLF